MTLQTTSFTILGAGLMGRLLAVALARQGHAVSIYDSGGPLAEHSASRRAVGLLVLQVDIAHIRARCGKCGPTPAHAVARAAGDSGPTSFLPGGGHAHRLAPPGRPGSCA